MHGGSLKIENIIMALLRLSDDHHLWLANLSSANLFTDENFTQFMEDLAQSLLQAEHKIAHLGNSRVWILELINNYSVPFIIIKLIIYCFS